MGRQYNIKISTNDDHVTMAHLYNQIPLGQVYLIASFPNFFEISIAPCFFLLRTFDLSRTSTWELIHYSAWITWTHFSFISNVTLTFFFFLKPLFLNIITKICELHFIIFTFYIRKLNNIAYWFILAKDN